MAAEVTTREGSLEAFDGLELFWRSWQVGSPKAVFAVVHGLGEHSGRYRRFAEAMAVRGLSTYAVDLRGMGRSPGRRGHLNAWSDWVQDASRFVGMVNEQAGATEVVPLGHSFGGVVVLEGILDGALKPRRFVLSNPALRTRVKVPAWKLGLARVTARLMPSLTLSNEVDPAAVSRDPAEVHAYSSDPLVHDKISSRLFSEWTRASADALARADQIRTPFLVILGESDRLIDPDGSRELARRATAAPADLRPYPGRYHEPFNDLDADEVFDDLAAWAARAPLPAGS